MKQQVNNTNCAHEKSLKIEMNATSKENCHWIERILCRLLSIWIPFQWKNAAAAHRQALTLLVWMFSRYIGHLNSKHLKNRNLFCSYFNVITFIHTLIMKPIHKHMRTAHLSSLNGGRFFFNFTFFSRKLTLMNDVFQQANRIAWMRIAFAQNEKKQKRTTENKIKLLDDVIECVTFNAGGKFRIILTDAIAFIDTIRSFNRISSFLFLNVFSVHNLNWYVDHLLSTDLAICFLFAHILLFSFRNN